MNAIARRLVGVLALILLAGLLAGMPVLLWWVTKPFVPAGLPSWDSVVTGLFSRDDGSLIAIALIAAAWVAWAYLAIALLIEIWAAIRRVPAPRLPGFSIPQGAAKRLVGAALLAFIAAPAAMGVAHADTTAPTTSTQVAVAATQTAPTTPQTADPSADAQREVVEHTVTSSDTLISLAKRYLGDGDRYLEIFKANRGMVQSNGARLTNPDLIVDGTVLKITLDTHVAPPAPTIVEPTHSETTPPAVEDDHQPAAPTATPAERTKTPATSTGNQERREPTQTSTPTSAQTATQTTQNRAVIQASSDTDDAEAEAGIRTSYGLGALAAVGVVSLIGTRRFMQRRTRARGAAFAMPEGATAKVEQELRATQNPLAIEEVDLALRSLALHCRETGTALPEIRVARLTAAAFEIYTMEPERLPEPWVGAADGMMWSFQVDSIDDLDRDALREISAPFPALVCLGQDVEDAHVLVDLETVTEMNVDGPQDEAEQVLAALAIELATSHWADDLTVTLVGAFPEMEDVLQTGRIRYLPTPARLFEELQRRAAEDRLLMEYDGVSDPHAARVTAVAPSSWYPEIILLTQPVTATQAQQLDQLLTELPRVAIASVAIGDRQGEWSIVLDGEAAVLEPIGLSITPQRITSDAYGKVLEIVDITVNGQAIANEANPDAVATLVDDAAAYLADMTKAEADEAPRTPQSATNQEEEEPEPRDVVELGPRAGTPFLRVLGPVELVGAEGPVEPNRAARLTEYLAYLLLTEGPITGRGIDDAVWPNRKNEDNSATRNPVTARLRKWLGTTSEGELRLNLNTFEVVDVDTDWHQFSTATQGDLTQLPDEQLSQALSLVRGAPFRNVAVRNLYYAWAEPIQQKMISRILDVCYEQASRQLKAEEWQAAEVTLATGIDIEPGDEQLWRMRILAARARHNQTAVDEAIARLNAQLEAFDVPPESETIEFLRRLDDGGTVADLMEMI